MHNIDYRYLRPKKAEALRSWYEEPFTQRQDLPVWKGCNATILPLRKVEGDSLLFGRGGVVDESGAYVSLSGIPGRVYNPYPFAQPVFRDRKVVYCGYLINHWGHFLIEAVTRLWYFLEQDPTIDSYVFFLRENEEREIKGNYRLFLELLGIWDKLEFVTTPTTYREVLVPDRGLICRNSFSPRLTKVFDTIADNVRTDPSWETPRKIFYSRSLLLSKASSNDIGFAAIDDFFARNGYTILYPERVPLDQMIHYIRNAEVVASLSGSLPHNMLFANQGQMLEIMERLPLNVDNQVDINRMRELNVIHVDANIPVYPTDFSGPFIMGYTSQMRQFAQDRNYQAPDSKYLTEAHFKKCFVQYITAYKDLYNYRWFMDGWYSEVTDSLWEGFEAGMEYFGDYLNRKKPFLPHHYFELHYWKQAVKRLLHRD